MGVAANLSKAELVSGIIATGATAGILSVKNKESVGLQYESRAYNQNEAAVKFSVDEKLTNAYYFGEPLYQAAQSSCSACQSVFSSKAKLDSHNCHSKSNEQALPANMYMIGTVKWFNETKGYGFIAPEDGSKDSFLHVSALEKAGLSYVSEGQKLEFDVEENRGKTSACNIRTVEA